MDTWLQARIEEQEPHQIGFPVRWTLTPATTSARKTVVTMALTSAVMTSVPMMANAPAHAEAGSSAAWAMVPRKPNGAL